MICVFLQPYQNCNADDNVYCHNQHTCQACSLVPNCYWSRTHNLCVPAANATMEEQQVFFPLNNYLRVTSRILNSLLLSRRLVRVRVVVRISRRVRIARIMDACGVIRRKGVSIKMVIYPPFRMANVVNGLPRQIVVDLPPVGILIE